MAALLPVLGGGVVHPAGATPRVADLGDRFEASAAGQTGLYVDAARDCTERARVAAVFIALALNPPTFQSGTVARVPSPVPSPVPPAPGRWFHLGAALRVDGASVGRAPAGIDLAWGGELSAGLGDGAFGGVMTVGALGPTTSQYSPISVREQRFPVSLAFRARRDLRRVQLAGDLGLSAVLLTFRGQALQTSDAVVRLDVGARVALGLRFPTLLNHVAPTLALHAEYFPRPYDLDVDPVGSIGSSSRLWLGASLGLSYETSQTRSK
ncbi:MAG TPA: hypothetical protein VGP07_08915 [Polyangia bacterium]